MTRNLADEIQQRFDASILMPAPDELERADATLLAAARLFYGAVLERLALSPSAPDYFSSLEPGALKAAQLRKYETVGRAVLAELAGGPPVAAPASRDDESRPAMSMYEVEVPAPGSLVRHARTGVAWRVIRSRMIADQWQSVCERVGGEQAGELETILSRDLHGMGPA